jgi:hypothetical protein
VGTYAETLLSDGEVIVRRERQHWLSLFLDARSAVALWLVGILLWVAIVVFSIKDTAGQLLGWVILGALILGLLIFAWNYWHWRTEEYLVTNRRLLKVSGIFNKESGDSSLEKINDAILIENLLGRMLDYGDLDILTAAEVAVDKYRMLNHAKAFKIEMLNAKHTLEHEVAYVAMPSPPIRAEQAPAPTPMAAAAPVAAPAPEAAAPNPIDTSEEVTQALARLADLRDRGAITPEEFDTKKADLLSRL